MNRRLLKTKGARLKDLAKTYAAIFLAFFILLGANPVAAKDLPNYPLYTHIAKGESLATVIKGFASNLGYPVVISPAVQGNVNGRFSDTPNPFLNRLASIYNLAWYFDGSRLFVYGGDEVETSIVKVQHIGISQLKRTMLELGILDHRTTWRSLPSRRIAYIAGPPRFVKLAQEMIQVLDTNRPRGLSGNLSVEVFPLKYALAYDRHYESRGEKTVVKGVATMLKNILMGTQAPVSGGGGSVSPKGMEALTGVTGANGTINQAPAAPPTKSSIAGEAHIEANRHLNAVIIRDRAENMDMYARLIDKLDVELEQVEINVSIIDISTNHLDKLGVEWSYENKDVKASHGNPKSDISDTLPSPTIISAGAKEFLGRVQLLSKDGDAKILSRPSILTMDKSEAIIDDSSTFYVKVAGKEAAELYPVSVGTMMRVTPRIVNDKENRWIHMDVSIEDGNQSGEEVDGVPSIKKSTINTRAVIAQKSSLLVGGYYYNKDSNSTNKVPLLGDLPIISPLFNWDQNNSSRMVRMFLISPRIIAKKETMNQMTPADIEKIYERVESFEVPDMTKKPVETPKKEVTQ